MQSGTGRRSEKHRVGTRGNWRTKDSIEGWCDHRGRREPEKNRNRELRNNLGAVLPCLKFNLIFCAAEYQKIKSSKTILIVGGGPTGVELAGEIAVDFPDKKVTLVHRGARLLEFIGHRAARKALDFLISKKVEVILGQSINLNSASNGVYQTSGGETITADCHFDCTGVPMGSSWLSGTILQNSLNLHKSLMVDANLRVKGHKNVFGIGDITDIPEIKQGYLAQTHAMVAAKNLKLLMTGGEESRMAIYKPGRPLAIVSLGRNDAVAQIFFITIIGWIPGYIKSRDLFVGRTRKQLGLKPDPS
ncbi:hypothetical protein U1Q18_025906 [Sarracenia purpurea var. burkii]